MGLGGLGGLNPFLMQNLGSLFGGAAGGMGGPGMGGPGMPPPWMMGQQMTGKTVANMWMGAAGPLGARPAQPEVCKQFYQIEFLIKCLRIYIELDFRLKKR